MLILALHYLARSAVGAARRAAISLESAIASGLRDGVVVFDGTA